MDLEIGLLLVMGAVVIATRHVLEEHLATPAGTIAAQMAGGLLRSLGLTATEARRIADSAARYIFPPRSRSA